MHNLHTQRLVAGLRSILAQPHNLRTCAPATIPGEGSATLAPQDTGGHSKLGRAGLGRSMNQDQAATTRKQPTGGLTGASGCGGSCDQLRLNQELPFPAFSLLGDKGQRQGGRRFALLLS